MICRDGALLFPFCPHIICKVRLCTPCAEKISEPLQMQRLRLFCQIQKLYAALGTPPRLQAPRCRNASRKRLRCVVESMLYRAVSSCRQAAQTRFPL